MNHNWAITTSQEVELLIQRAKAIGEQYHILYVPRHNKSLNYVKQLIGAEILLVAEKEQLIAHHEQGKLMFHPGMAVPRLKVLAQGQQDSMIKAMNLKVGDRVLDCTIGLANDAIVASSIVGEQGQVQGIESSAVIYVIVREGLKQCRKGSLDMQQAMDRIKICYGNYTQILPNLDDNCFDVVYFDPMFDRALTKSPGIAGLRAVANYQELTADDLLEALRIARRRVVVKHRKGSLPSQWFNWVEGGKYSPIAFGILEKKDEENTL